MTQRLRQIEFKDFITLQRGFDLPRKDIVHGQYPVVGSTSVIGYNKDFKVEPPGVITGRSGSLGTVQYVVSRYWPHNTALWVKDFKGNCPRYVYYFLQTLSLDRFNSGVGVPTLNRNDLDTLGISVHQGVDQEKIAAILGAYDDLIENSRRRIKILKEIAQSLYREWFIHFRFSGYERIRFVDSCLGKIPQGWEITRVADFGQVITGKTPSKSVAEYFGQGIPFIKIPDMHGEMFCLQTTEELTEDGARSQPKKTLPEGSICVSCIGTAGLVTLTTRPSQTNQQINSIVPDHRADREFLYHAMTGLSDKIQSYGATGATMANLSKGKFESLEVITPPRSVRDDFHRITAPLFDLIKVLGRQNKNLSGTRDLLLPKLITGEVDVKSVRSSER